MHSRYKVVPDIGTAGPKGRPYAIDDEVEALTHTWTVIDMPEFYSNAGFKNLGMCFHGICALFVFNGLVLGLNTSPLSISNMHVL